MELEIELLSSRLLRAHVGDGAQDTARLLVVSQPELAPAFKTKFLRAALADAEIGEEVILVNYEHQRIETPFNRWISSSEVAAMSDEMHKWQGTLLAPGYIRD